MAIGNCEAVGPPRERMCVREISKPWEGSVWLLRQKVSESC
jgi:hypothetical protein